MKAYPEQPSGSVMLLLATKKFSTPNVETLKAFSRENKKNTDSHQTLVFNRGFRIFTRSFTLLFRLKMKYISLSFTFFAMALIYAGC